MSEDFRPCSLHLQVAKVEVRGRSSILELNEPLAVYCDTVDGHDSSKYHGSAAVSQTL